MCLDSSISFMSAKSQNVLHNEQILFKAFHAHLSISTEIASKPGPNMFSFKYFKLNTRIHWICIFCFWFLYFVFVGFIYFWCYRSPLGFHL